MACLLNNDIHTDIAPGKGAGVYMRFSVHMSVVGLLAEPAAEGRTGQRFHPLDPYAPVQCSGHCHQVDAAGGDASALCRANAVLDLRVGLALLQLLLIGVDAPDLR